MSSSNSSVVDITGLRAFYKASPSAKAFLDYCARRVYVTASSKASRLMQQLGISRSEAVGVLQKLRDLGCGVFVPGRRGGETRLEWSVNLIHVGKAARGELSEIEPLGASETLVEEGEGCDDELVNEDAVNGATKLLDHPFRLRPNLTVTAQLPADLTAGEAARLADFVRTLPFDRGSV